MISMKQNKETNLIEDNQNRINKDKNYNLMDPTKFHKFDRCSFYTSKFAPQYFYVNVNP